MANIASLQHVPGLPTEVWTMICESLEGDHDFGALFSTALVSRGLAQPAVKSLYRIHHHSPVISEGSEIEMRSGGQTNLQEEAISKWSTLWRSMMLSSLGKTTHPYCLYIKSLNLSNLSELFENGVFRDSIQNTFFTDDIAALLTSTTSSHTKRFGKQSTRRQNLKFNADLSREVIGESITKYIYDFAQSNRSGASIEEISGKIPGNLLLLWCGRLTRLRTLTLWDGNSLGGDVGRQIGQNCPGFESLSIYSFLGDAADKNLAAFLNNLCRNSLSYFHMIHSNDIHEASLSALSKHSQSLKELKLSSLKSNAIRCLGLLKACTNLTTLSIQDREGRIDLEDEENDTLLEVVSWLRGCKKLENLTIDNIVSGVNIAIPVLHEESIKLKKFEMVKFLSSDLYPALAHMQSLEELKLRGDAPTTNWRITAIVDEICKLPHLKILDLLSVSDNFQDSQLRHLCQHLLQLRELAISGENLTDSILTHLHNMVFLRSLHFNALTRFTFAALQGYILNLAPTNNGFVLSILSQASDCNITEAELAQLKSDIEGNVNGKFEFLLYRDSESDLDGYETEFGD